MSLAVIMCTNLLYIVQDMRAEIGTDKDLLLALIQRFMFIYLFLFYKK